MNRRFSRDATRKTIQYALVIGSNNACLIRKIFHSMCLYPHGQAEDHLEHIFDEVMGKPGFRQFKVYFFFQDLRPADPIKIKSCLFMMKIFCQFCNGLKICQAVFRNFHTKGSFNKRGKTDPSQ